MLCVNWRTPHPFDDAERAVLEIFANHVAIAIETTADVSGGGGSYHRPARRLHRDLHDEVVAAEWDQAPCFCG